MTEELLGDPDIPHVKVVDQPDEHISVKDIERLGFKKELVRGEYRYVYRSFKDIFNMYSEPIKKTYKLRVYPQWLLDTLSVDEIETILEYEKNIIKRFDK